MDDIVDRLRDTAYEAEVCWEAAAEIERLRHHAEQLAEGLHQWGIFADEYLPHLMARPGSTALRNWEQHQNNNAD